MFQFQSLCASNSVSGRSVLFRLLFIKGVNYLVRASSTKKVVVILFNDCPSSLVKFEMCQFFNTSTCLFFQVWKKTTRNTCPALLFFSKCVIWRALPTRFFHHNFSLPLSLSLSFFLSAVSKLFSLAPACCLFSFFNSDMLRISKKQNNHLFVIVCVLVNLIFSFVNTLLSYLK